MLKFIANNNSDSQQQSKPSLPNNTDIQHQPTSPGKDSNLRIPQLDGIRGFAMLLVLVWHFVMCQVPMLPGSITEYSLAVFAFTWSGVDLFFVLSGFLIGGILLNQKNSPHYFKTFYIRRICRIFPLYYLMLGLFVLFSAIYLTGTRTEGETWLFRDPLPLWSYSTYLQNFSMAYYQSFGAKWMGITWSLAIEEQFYIVLPLMVRFLPERKLVRILIVMICLAPLLRGLLLYLNAGDWTALYVLMPARMDALFLGVLGAIAVRNPTSELWIRNHLNWVKWVVIITFVILALLLVTRQVLGTWGMTLIGHLAIAFMSLAYILLATLSPTSYYSRFFQLRPLIWIGTYSYGIYLFHQPISGLLHGTLLKQAPQIVTWTDALVTLLALVVTLIVSKLSWQLFESPLVDLGKKYKY